jgi:hypothetical protein
MKTFKSLGFLLGTIALLLFPEPSFGKDTWLKCNSPDYKGNRADSPPFTLKLNSVKESFEIQYLPPNGTYMGKATFFQSAIKFQYSHSYSFDPGNTYNEVYEINRATLKYSRLVSGVRINGYLERNGMGVPPSEYSGSCKVIPAPSNKKNLI